MALYAKQKSDHASGIDQFRMEANQPLNVAPAKMDEMLLEALEALEQARRLHESTPNPETKRQAKQILDNLHSSLLKLAPLGIHSVGRLERMPVNP